MTALLDHAPSDWHGRLWLVRREDATHEICDEESKGGRPGFGPSWNEPYRQQLAAMVRQIEGNAEFWVEVAQDLAANPLLPKAGDAVVVISPDFFCYSAYVEQKGGGFGGERFDVEMANGVTFWSANVWSRGLVPAYLRKRLLANGKVKGLR